MSSWLKAGLIGGAVLVVLDLLGLIPCVVFITWILMPVAYAGIGVLAAYWLPPARAAGQAAGQGALAAVLAALIGGVVNAIILTVQYAVVNTSAILSQIPAETLQQLQQAGIDPASLVGPRAGALCGSGCCITGLVLAAILGAVGAAIFAAVKPD